MNPVRRNRVIGRIISNHCWHYVIAIFLLTACLPLSAAVAAAPPDSGAALDSVKQPESPPSVATIPGDMNIPEPETVPPSGNRQKIRVAGFRFSGETIVPAKELLQFINDQAGKDLTLDDLNGLAAQITKYLRGRGYPVAFAYIPAQHIKDGIVTIAVVPGKFGAIRINNQARITTPQFQKILAILKSGAIIAKKDLERVLLLLNDLSGVKAQVSLKPGESAGTSDLIVEIADTAPAGGNVSADTWGSRYTGATRGGVQLTLNNLDHIGDELRLGGLSSAKGLDNGSLAYSLPLTGDGLQLNLTYNTVSYSLGEDFASLDATGQARVYGLELNYPIMRSRRFNLYAAAGFEDKELRDVVGSTATDTSRTSSLWHLGLSGNVFDNWRGGGVNNVSLTLYGGYLDITDSDAYDTDAVSANSAGEFCKAVLAYSRSQYLGQGLNLDLRCNGQLASKNLDSSEKFYLGGADGVRAYPQGEGAGDEGLRVTAEIKWLLPGIASDRGHLYLAGFCDYGYVTVNKNPWNTAAGNSRGLSAYGFGLIFTWSSDFYLRCDYAWKLGNAAATGDTDQPGRCWIKIVKNF